MDRTNTFQNHMVIDLYINVDIIIYFLNQFPISFPLSFLLAHQKGKTDKIV